jgi:hypothetical protein
MAIKLKHIISTSLMVIFMIPLTVKLLDSKFHHHDHDIFSSKNENHFQGFQKKCAILGFEFSLYSLSKIILKTQKIFYFDKLFTNYVSNHSFSKSKFSFLLRAPPLNIHN